MMGEDTVPEASSLRKVYPFGPRRAFVWLQRIIVGLFVLIAFGYGYAWSIGHFQQVGLGLVVAVWLLLALQQAAVLYLFSRSRLMTSPAGLEFSAPGYRISTTWDNIETVRVEWPLSLEMLDLRQKPVLHHRHPLSWLWLRVLERKRFPLYLFQRSWQGELGQDFRQYAPHLFSAEEREQPQ